MNILKILTLLAISIPGLTACSGNDNTEPGQATSTGSIYGIIVDKDTAEPIRGAQVKLHSRIPLNKLGPVITSTVTYDDGHFEFNDIAISDTYSNTFFIAITQSGYESLTHEVTVFKSKTSHIDITLAPLKFNVVTEQAVIASNNSVHLNGSISYTTDELHILNAGFYVSEAPNPKDSGEKIAGTSTQNKSWTTTLYPESGTFHAQAFAETDFGTFYGNVITYSITHSIEITTDDVIIDNNNTVHLSSILTTTLNNIKLSTAGFYISPQPNPKTTGTKTNAILENKAWTLSVAPGIGTFYAQAFAETSAGTYFGQELSFTVSEWYVMDNLAIQKIDLSLGANWFDADAMCRSSQVGGFSDWRLPTKSELETINDYLNYGNYYWSSSSASDRLGYTCHYGYRRNDYGYRPESYYDINEFRVRAVRTIK